jgi:hypothetical protein
MNNSFPRLIDGMCATLRAEVLTRLDDEFARGQVYGVINLLNTFKVRADWSAGFLMQQIEAQHTALGGVTMVLQGLSTGDAFPQLPQGPSPATTPVSELLALRDAGNQSIADLLVWIDAEGSRLNPEVLAQIEKLLQTAMLAEVAIELKNSPKPLFAQMSSGQEE